MLRVCSQQEEGDALEGCSSRIHLGEDVDAVAVRFDHLLNASNLTFDPAQASDDSTLVVAVTDHSMSLATYLIPA